MEVTGVNPFLMEDEHTSPQSSFNPFLMEDASAFEVPESTENPFFGIASEPQNGAAAANNPFAFDAMEYEPNESIFTSSEIFTSVAEPITTSAPMHDLMDDDQMDADKTVLIIPTSVVPTKPTELHLENTTADDKPQRPPPPPRPVIPSATQDLILSVTGHMDATSSHLLDRIPPTRTPSPVSMRDLHSPSPTPDTFANDLVDVGHSEPKEVNLFDLENDDLTSMSSNTTTDPFGNFTPENNVNVPSSEPQPIDPFSSFSDPIIPQAVAPKPLPSRPPPPKAIPPQKPPPPQVPPPPPNRTPATSPPNNNAPPKPPPPKTAPPKPPLPAFATPIASVTASPVQPDTDFFTTPVQRVSKPDIFEEPPRVQRVSKPDIFAEPVKVKGSSPRVSQPDIFAEAIILETTTSPQDAQNLNPFTVQDEIVPTVTNTQTNAQLFDDFTMLSSATNTTTTATILDTIPDSGTGFETEQKKSGGFSDLFGASEPNDIFVEPEKPFEPTPKMPSLLQKFQRQSEEFDAFAAKFESAKDNQSGFDAFGGGTLKSGVGDDAWGSDAFEGEKATGFGDAEPFDSFLSLSEPPPAPQCTPARITKMDSDSDEDKDFAVFIKPKNLDLPGAHVTTDGFVPTLAPPPKSPLHSSLSDNSPRFNPFDQQQEFGAVLPEPGAALPTESAHLERTDSQETPPTPLFDDDTSQPLEQFPRIVYSGEGWEMQLRQPNKKKITGQRFWKKIFLKLVYQGDNPVLQLYNAQTDKDPFQELPLQACYSVSEIGAQQYDQFGKIFTVKLQYVFYKERPGVRPGQVTKAERITNKLSQFAAYAIQGDYQGVKEFGSDLKKLGLPVEHAPQISQLFKIGSQNYEHMKEFSMAVEEALFRLTVHRDRALHYKMEEVQITAVDELYVEQNAEGGIDKQIARVRLFFLGFLSGMPDIELGVNDMRRQGKEVVGRHDIIPVVTEEWIRLENYEFHACVQQDEYQKTHIIRFKPPDACYIELMRFRIRPPRNRELPLQLKAVMCVTGNKVELRADVLVPGFASRKLGQVPCEDVMIRFPIPECWIYLFRVEKHFRYGSVKSTHRRTGKVKGIERFLGTVETLQESLIEVTSGQAKYEHQHRSIVWRCPRLPKEGQGAYTTHNLVCRMALTSYDQIPEQLSEYAYVEFTMPATQVSHTTVRSVSVQGSDSDEPPEKYVRYLARHEYRVGIEHTKGEGPGSYLAATMVRPAPIAETPSPAAPAAAESSDSDSD